ncbi:MAG: RsmB/NOP family class I SAM-dependent RNA methyltransferase [Candidatus Altiarchaeota archaeon]
MPPSKSFKTYHQGILGRDYRGFMDYIQRPPARYSVRVNTLKSSLTEVERILRKRRVDYGSIPWCSDGLWVSQLGLDFLEHQLGFFYIQSADSMIPVLALDPQPGERVLDMCAAPGGKSTHIAQLMRNTGTLVANDNNVRRIRALVYSIQKSGVRNAVITQNDGVRLSGRGMEFDRILVDAPCSDVGTARKNPQIFDKWDMEWVRALSALQKKMASAAYGMLKPGGVMVYSTCTTTLEENEHVVEHVLSEEGAELAEVKLDGLNHSKGLTDKAGKSMRIMPQHNDTGCFYIAKVVKNG